MGLETIEIKNYKSIRNCRIDLKQLNLLLGKNGSGKTNILSAINYFYRNLISNEMRSDCFDNTNHLNDCIEITFVYSIHKLLVRMRKNRTKKEHKYEDYYQKIESISKDEKIILTFTQIKNGSISWNHDFSVRRIIFNLFPLYHLDARAIDLMDWESLWRDIGDYIKPDTERGLSLQEKIKDTIQQEDGMLASKLEILAKVFGSTDLKPLSYTPKEYSSSLAKLFFNGSQFFFHERELSTFSNGTNSFNYIIILLKILDLIGNSKLKEPILLMDEPEISLHFHMIDVISDELYACTDNVLIIVTTHSARFVKNILTKDVGLGAIFQIYFRNGYTNISNFQMFGENQRERYFMTEQHSNAYFADVLLLVEGETEIEVFNNPYLRVLFPNLKHVEVIKSMSNDVVQSIVSTNIRHFNVPTIALVDMDKIIEWDPRKNHVSWIAESMEEKKSEQHFYGKKRYDLLHLHKRIRAMCDKCIFSYHYPLYSSTDYTYYELLRCIKDYYLFYDTFVVESTIEGMIINNDNLYIFIEFLQLYEQRWDAINESMSYLHYDRDKLNYIRLLFRGKSDMLMKIKKIKEANEYLMDGISKVLENNSIKKTQWVGHFFRWYFSTKIEKTNREIDVVEFERCCRDKEKRNNILEQFKIDFKELTELIDIIDRKIL